MFQSSIMPDDPTCVKHGFQEMRCWINSKLFYYCFTFKTVKNSEGRVESRDEHTN